MATHMSGSGSVEPTARHGNGHGCTGDPQSCNISQSRTKSSGLELKHSALDQQVGHVGGGSR